MLFRMLCRYLEETAVDTYSNIVKKCETPGTKLHTAWAHLPAPEIAKNYWCLPDDATWITTLKHMLADEAHHRDVNHTFASLPRGEDNPFIHEHRADFDKAVLRRSEALLKHALEDAIHKGSGHHRPHTLERSDEVLHRGSKA